MVISLAPNQGLSSHVGLSDGKPETRKGVPSQHMLLSHRGTTLRVGRGLHPAAAPVAGQGSSGVTAEWGSPRAAASASWLPSVPSVYHLTQDGDLGAPFSVSLLSPCRKQPARGRVGSSQCTRLTRGSGHPNTGWGHFSPVCAPQSPSPPYLVHVVEQKLDIRNKASGVFTTWSLERP